LRRQIVWRKNRASKDLQSGSVGSISESAVVKDIREQKMGSENEEESSYSPLPDAPPSAPPSGDDGGEEGRAIPFITLSFDSDGKAQFTVTEEARDMLTEIEGPLSVISVVGMYRTGKSFLLNRILLGQTGGFPVGNTVNACTKGLWIWSKPLRAKAADGTPVNLLVNHPGGNPGANLYSVFHRYYLREVAFDGS
jgi:hypothetical protein